MAAGRRELDRTRGSETAGGLRGLQLQRRANPLASYPRYVSTMASSLEPLEALNAGLAIGAVIVIAVRRALRAIEDRR